jgi:superfamily I DNA/RNA helicase
MERYKYLIEELKVPSEDILVLVSNHQQKEKWDLLCTPSYSGLLWITTYYGFIKDELTVFYPYVLENCSEIKYKSIKPLFMTFECSRFFLEKAIEGRRRVKGAFSSIASSDSRIASELASVFAAASVSGAGQDEISQRLCSALGVKDMTRERLYGEAQELIADYRKKCLELGVFDTALAAEVYNRYLLNNENYRKKLHEKVKHLIADDIQICTPVETDLIELLLKNLKTCVLSFNHETAKSSGTGEGFNLLREKLLSKCRIFELEETHTCPDFMSEFSDMLYENISKNSSKPFEGDVNVERHPVSELRSDMLKSAAERVISLVQDEGVKPSDIVILSTYADRVTDTVYYSSSDS